MPAEGILQSALFDDVDVSAKQFPQLLPHGDPIPQAPRRIRMQTHQYVDVAVGAEIVPENRAEQREFTDQPFPAELGDPIAVDVGLV